MLAEATVDGFRCNFPVTSLGYLWDTSVAARGFNPGNRGLNPWSVGEDMAVGGVVILGGLALW